MIRMIGFIFTLCFFLNAVFAQTYAQSPAAIVLDVKGKCRLVANGSDKPVKNGMFVNSRDSLVIPPKGAVLLMDSLDRYITVSTSSAYIMPVGDADKTGQFFREWLAARQWFEKTRKKSWDGLRSAADQLVTLNPPRNTRLRQMPGILSWTSKSKNITSELSIRCYENDFTFKTSVKQNQYTLTKDMGLEKGQQYYWSVNPEGTDLSQLSTPVWFAVMNDEQQKQFLDEWSLLKNIMGKDTTSIPYQLLYANLLNQHQLNNDCQAVLDAVLKAEPNHPVALMFYARLMEQMDLPEQAKQYIELTVKYER